MKTEMLRTRSGIIRVSLGMLIEFEGQIHSIKDFKKIGNSIFVLLENGKKAHETEIKILRP